jgi:hypothetical protein
MSKRVNQANRCSSKPIRRMPGRLTLTFVSLLTFFAATNTEIGVSCFAVGTTHSTIKSDRRSTPAVSSMLPELRQRTILGASVAAAGAGDKEPSASTVQYIRGGDMAAASVKKWPTMDALDKRLIKIALPCILNFAIAPLVGAVDLFWVNRMGNPLAVAGQSAANQVFNSAFWLASFLPSGTFNMLCDVCELHSWSILHLNQMITFSPFAIGFSIQLLQQ